MRLGYTYISILLLILISGCNTEKQKPDQKIGFAKDGMMMINGKRKFIIGSYHHPKTNNPFKILANNGYNYVHVSPEKEQLDAAHKNGLMTWITTGIVNEKNNDDAKRIENVVNTNKNHPSLLFWEIADEPAFNWNNPEPRITPEQMLEAYQIIKANDDGHPVITNHGPVNLISTLQKYNSSTDLVACDVYPVIPHGIKPTYALYPDGLQGDLLNPYISQVGEYVEKMKKVVDNKIPIFMVLQGFAWEMLKEEEERDSSMILYPTYEQSRFMAYNAIVHGATGVLYWGTNYTPQPSPFMNDLNKVTKELDAMQEVLAAPSMQLDIKKEYHELMYSLDTGVEFITKKVGDITYLLTVNSDKNPVKITFSNLGEFKNITIINEDRELYLEKGKFTDYYEPFGVHIYKLTL